MSSLDDLIQQSAAEELPDFSDVSGGVSSRAATAAPATPGGLDALIHASAQDLSASDFGDVSGGAASSARSLPEQSAPPAPGGLDPAFMHWYANYVKNTGAALSYDQARQLYKSLSPEQRAHVPAPPSPYSDLINNDLDRNVASGMKQGADFLAHLPETVARGVAAIPYSVNSALEAQDRQRRLDMAAAATETTGEDYVTPEQHRQATTPIPAPPQGNVMLPDIAEETFQSAREERERLQERAAARGAEAGQSPEAAALAYAVPQTLGNLIDPTMLLGVGESARTVKAGASWLDRLIARGAEEELGPRAADAAEPALTRAIEPSAELRERFPGATIDSQEYVEPAGQRRPAATGQPLPEPPEGIKPGEPWLQRPIGSPTADEVPKTVDLGGAGRAIADNLYDGIWSRLEAGKLPEPFPAEGQSPAARLVAEAYARGELKGPEDVRAIMNDYARRTYGKDEADAALRAEERAHADQQAPVGGAVEERHAAGEPGSLEGQGAVAGDARPIVVRAGDWETPEGADLIRRPGHVYRGMTGDEYYATIGSGSGVRSRRDFSLPSEGTSFSEDPKIAEDYANFGRTDPRKTGRPNYLVEVVNDPKLLSVDPRDGYVKADAEVPRTHVTRVWRMEASKDGKHVIAVPERYRSPEGDLAPGAEGAGGPLPGQPLAAGVGPEALPAGDGRLAEGAGEPLVTVNGRTFRLTEEGRARWDAAQAEHDRHLQWAASLDAENQAKQLKAAGMKLSAERRQITGALTGKEAQAAAAEPLKLRFGKDVTVDGQPAKIVGAPFGKVKVRFKDSTERLVTRDAVSVVKENAPALAEEVIPPVAKPFKPGELPESLPLPEEKPFAPDELPSKLPQLTSLKKAYSEPERAERGLSPVEREFFGTTDETMAKARNVVEADPSWPRQLAQRLIEEDRPPRPHEVAELLYDKAKILKEEKAAMDALEAARAAGDDVAGADARQALAQARQALDANTEASRRSLAQWGEAGRLSQLVIREDYSTSRVLQRARTAAADGALPPELEKKLTDLSARVETTSKALDEAKDQLAAMRLKKALSAMQRETELESRRAARRQVRQSLDEELADLSGQLEKRAAAKQGKLFSTTNPFQGLDPESIAIIGKIAKNRVKAGVNTAEELVDSVFSIVRNHFEGITPRDVRDAISGYGTAPKGSRAVAESQLSRVKREMRLLSKVEDAQAGVMPAKSGVARKASPEIKALEKRLRQEMRAQGLDRNMRLDAYRSRLETRKADLERQLATGDFTPVGRPLAVEDATTRKLKVEIEGLKSKIDTEVKRLERANRTPGEKVRDLFLKWRRATLLSSSQTVGKLLSAAETRTLVTTPVEQLIGAGWAHVPGVRRIAALAPREGTVSLNAEAKAWASAFSKETWKDAWETGMPGWAGGRGTGKGELDILYGKKSDFPPEVLDFFGHLHAGLKTLAKRPEFERSLALRYKHAAMHGIDTSLPEVQAEIASKAYADAMRAVLLQDNALVDGFRAFQGMLRKRGATGTAAATDFFLPIVKVPSNYVTEAAEYGFGPARALTRVIWKGGIENLEEHDAEYIMRNLKKGTLGTSLLALGYYGYDKIGGYRQRNEHREEGDVQPMTIRMNLFGNEVDIPHALLHAPALEMVQVGATLHRLQDAYADRGKEHGTLAGELAGTRGLLEQVPFYGELLRTQEGLESPTGFTNYMGNLGRSIFIPPDIQRAAKVMDQEQSPGPFAAIGEQLGLKHFEPVRRYPQNFFWDQMKVGIPWVREQVSDEKNP